MYNGYMVLHMNVPFLYSVFQSFYIKSLGIANLFHISLPFKFQEGFPVLCWLFLLSFISFSPRIFWAVLSNNYEDI